MKARQFPVRGIEKSPLKCSKAKKPMDHQRVLLILPNTMLIFACIEK